MTLTSDNVISIYSGRAGACCCGCKGEHATTEVNAGIAEKSNGYPMPVNEVLFDSVLRRLNATPAECIAEDGLVYREIGGRVFIAYLKEPTT